MKNKVTIDLHPVAVGNKKRSVPHTVNALNLVHWSTRRKWKKAWEEEVIWSVKEKRSLFPKFPLPYAQVDIVYYNIRTMDEDNMHGSAKPLFDGLVKVGLLIDDKPKYLSQSVKQERVKTRKERGVSVTISWT